MLNGLILGIEHEELLERFDEIAAFADIGEFIDQPMKTYSSGMRSRLGFAVAVNVEPDVLLIDEALSAGDAAFKRKALQRMYDLRDSGTTVLFVSHSLGMISRFCTDAVLLHKGGMVSSGSPEEVVAEYRALLENSQEQRQREQPPGRDRLLDEAIGHEDEEDMGEAPARGDAARGARVRGAKGEAAARIVGAELLDGARSPVDSVVSGAQITVRVHVEYRRATQESDLSITLRDSASGTEVFSTDTLEESQPLGRREAGERVAVDFTFDVPLRPGSYEVDVSVSAPAGGERDRIRAAATLRIGQEEEGRPVRGLLYLPTAVEVLD
jgi:ABC-2 type transport system ATP-binding protein